MKSFNIIAYVPGNQEKNIEPKFLKYHNILGTKKGLAKFVQFLKIRNPELQHVNLYDPVTKKFISQIKIKKQNDNK